MDNGRPSTAPGISAVALLLQWYDNVSDEEAARRAKLDLGWKVALGLELKEDFQGTDNRSEVRCPAGHVTGTYYERRAGTATRVRRE